jgi:hypothetical protein
MSSAQRRLTVGAVKTYEKLGMYSEAFAACDKALEYSEGNSEAFSLASYVHAVSGEQGRSGSQDSYDAGTKAAALRTSLSCCTSVCRTRGDGEGAAVAAAGFRRT